MTKSDLNPTPHKTVLTARVLGYGGALPFLVGAIMGSQDMALMGLTPTHFLLTYGAIILSFLGGLHWGRVITSSECVGSAGPAWLIWSVCPSLLGWTALLLPVQTAAVLLSACFLIVLGLDQKLFYDQKWPMWMRPLRLHLSIVAAASLLSIALQ